MTVWNTIDDTYSNFVLYIVTKPHFLIFASFQSIFSMAVWNTIGDRYSNFCFMQKRIQIFLFFAILESIFNRTVWNTIDDRFSNFVLPIRALTRILKIGVKTIPYRKSWSFTIHFYWHFLKSWSQIQEVGVKNSKFGVNETSGPPI